MLTAILAFYSPSGYRLPRQHLAETLAWLAAESVPTILAQVVRPGCEPQPVLPGQQSLVWESSDAIFYKENLYNLAAESTSADRLLFLDADVRFSCEIAPLVEAGLHACDIMQPFETAVWHDRLGDVYLTRRSAAYGLMAGREPSPGTYHPGFSWAMTRRAFDALGGFPMCHPFGGGDVALAYSLDTRWLVNNRREMLPEDTICWDAPSFLGYQARGTSARLRVGYCAGVEVHHSWHGDIKERQYVTRCSYVPIRRGEEYPLRKRPDGLLEWTDPAAAAAAQVYFDSRMEDGVEP